MNLDAVVELIESGEGAPVAVRVVGRSANRTFRVVFPDLKPGDDDDRWRQILIDMESWDCWFDVLSPGYLAISAPEATAEAVERYLNQRTAAGDFPLRTGRRPVGNRNRQVGAWLGDSDHPSWSTRSTH